MTMNRWKYMNINLMDDDRGMPVLKQNLKNLRPSFLFPEPEPPTSGESATPLFLSFKFSLFSSRIRIPNTDPGQASKRIYS